MAEEAFTERVKASRAQLGPAGRRVLAYIERHPVAALAGSAAELAARASTSDATVVRTAQALGFTGLADLRRALVAGAASPSTPADDMRRTLSEMALEASQAVETVLRAHEDGIAAIRSPDVQARLAQAALVLDGVARIVVFGIGPSAGLAGYVATLLRRSGRRSAVLDRTGAMLADQLLDLGPGDALVLLAYGRLYREVETVLDEARRLGLPVVLMTESARGKLASLADVAIPIPRGRPGRMALHGATLVALEALVLSLSAARPQAALGSLDRLGALRGTLSGA